MLVRKVNDVWQEWNGEALVETMVATFNAHYADGRVEEMACDPYPVTVRLDGRKVAELHSAGIWSDAEIAAVGASTFIPFTPPDGSHVVGAPSYFEDELGVRQTYEVEAD